MNRKEYKEYINKEISKFLDEMDFPYFDLDEPYSMERFIESLKEVPRLIELIRKYQNKYKTRLETK